MKKAKEIVIQYHSHSDEVNYKRQLLRMSNETSRLIETCANKNFRECGTTVPKDYFQDLKQELIDHGYTVTNDNFHNAGNGIVSFLIQW